MDTNELRMKLEIAVPGAVLEMRPFGRSAETSIWIQMQSIASISKFLAEEGSLSFDWLENISAMDIDQAIVISYFLKSTKNNTNLIVRGSVVPAGPQSVTDVLSVTSSWPMATPFEKEISDLFGIFFIGNGQTTKELLPENWPGFPLRKSYVFPSEYKDILHMRPAGRTGAVSEH